jgi:hypothetical protein
MFAIADEVLDLCRSVGHEATVLAVLADGLRNGPSDGAVLHQAIKDAGDLGLPPGAVPEGMAGLRRAQTPPGTTPVTPGYNPGIRTRPARPQPTPGPRLAPTPLLEQPLESWRDVYRAFGAKPQRTPCSAEALRKRAARGDVPVVDRLVDAYNAVSIRFAVPIGGEDRSLIAGTERLVLAAGDEPFDTVKEGVPVVETPEPGEVIWRDDLGVTCRRWNWRQGRRTAITAATTSAVFLLEGLDTDLTPAAAMLAELLDADTVTIERLA